MSKPPATCELCGAADPQHAILLPTLWVCPQCATLPLLTVLDLCHRRGIDTSTPERTQCLNCFLDP